MKTTDSQKRILTAVGLVLGIVVLGFAFYEGKQMYQKKVPSLDKILVQTAEVVNKSCPVMVDNETRLDNATVLPGKVLQYNYTLVNVDQTQISPDTLEKYLAPNIINMVRTNPDMKEFRDMKTTLNYYYKDKNGIFVYKLAVTPQMYE